MKFTLALSLIAGAAAFAPAAQQSASTALNANPLADQLGAQAPLGFWDPAGLCIDGDQANFDKLRAIEIKHGRVCMLGVVGFLVTEAGLRMPGAEDMPAGVAAVGAVPGMVWAQFFATTALMEAVNRDVTGKGEFPGDFRNGAIDFGWDRLSPEVQMKKRQVELNNGRAAQMGLTGLVIHDMLGNLSEIIPIGK